MKLIPKRKFVISNACEKSSAPYITRRKKSLIFIAIAMCFFINTKSIAQEKTATDLTHLNFTIEPATDWTNLFVRTSGWFGADGIYAIPADGARSKGGKSNSKNMFIFSDSMIGEIEDGKMQPGAKMVHNTVAYLKGDEPDINKITFCWATDDTLKPVSMFIPSTPSSQKKDYYWLGDGFFNQSNGKTYIFGYRMRNLRPKDDWSFSQQGVNLIILPKGSKAPFKDQIQVETPLHYDIGNQPNTPGGSYGAGIFVNTAQAGAPNPDGYVYVYGIRGRSGLVVARVLPNDFENFTAWRYWDGQTWNADMQKATVLTTNVSDELSFSPLPDGRYVLVSQSGNMSSQVVLRIAASPVGPFGPAIKVYNAAVTNSKYFTYNAKAHPSISKPGELLITYNQNSFDFWHQLQLNPNLYHPYFLRLKFQ
jgi:hypothetical protein